MHRCLLIPELLRLILENATEPEEGYPGPLLPLDRPLPPRAFALWRPATKPLSLALTCRAFLEPALDIIWHGIPCVDVFEGCLTSLDSPPNWERFRYYARRVREFGVRGGANHSVDCPNPLILSILINEDSTGPILPNVSMLIVQCREILAAIHRFVTPKLREMHLYETKSSSFRGACTASSSVISITDCIFSAEEIISLSNAMQGFTGLLQAHLQPKNDLHWPSELIRHFSTHLPLQSISMPLGLTPPAPSRGFPFLRSFYFDFPDTDSFLRQLDCITSTDLSKLSADIKSYVIGQSPMQLVLSTARDRLISALSAEVDFHELPSRTWTGGPDDERITSLEPLFDLHNLTSLRLRINRLVDIDDAMIQTMAHAWPKLRELSLNHYFRGASSCPTLQGLLPLAIHCRELESCSLAVNVDAISLDYNYFKDRARRCVNAVQQLEFFGVTGPVRDPHIVAAFLSDVFPKLRTVRGSELGRGWGTARETMEMVHAVRRQERMPLN
ncbi:hypothetical protein R3P38DRAFT_3627928 [Favolaschia claudopus]|uniref:F-box domain-containing protein n=1 Tax=Favolaschia claudopus TaxID=2862362 RepID=A0AAV9ZZD7_9AGAR